MISNPHKLTCKAENYFVMVVTERSGEENRPSSFPQCNVSLPWRLRDRQHVLVTAVCVWTWWPRVGKPLNGMIMNELWANVPFRFFLSLFFVFLFFSFSLECWVTCQQLARSQPQLSDERPSYFTVMIPYSSLMSLVLWETEHHSSIAQWPP